MSCVTLIARNVEALMGSAPTVTMVGSYREGHAPHVRNIVRHAKLSMNVRVVGVTHLSRDMSVCV